MKRFIATAVIASLISGAAFSQQTPTNVVSSANVVGYNQILVPSNQYVLVALDFVTTNNTLATLFPTLPTSSQVSLWNSASQQWNTFTKLRTGWSPSGTSVVSVASGAFVKLPAAPATNIYMGGDIPMSATTAVLVVNGYKIVSYPYPVDMPFTNTALAKGAATSDQVSFWANGWVTYTKLRTGWSPTTLTNVQLKVGDALFYKAATNRVANEVKPYTIN